MNGLDFQWYCELEVVSPFSHKKLIVYRLRFFPPLPMLKQCDWRDGFNL